MLVVIRESREIYKWVNLECIQWINRNTHFGVLVDIYGRFRISNGRASSRTYIRDIFTQYFGNFVDFLKIPKKSLKEISKNV